MNTELIGHLMVFADAVQRNPGAGCVGNVVVKIVARRPAGHRARFHAVREPARFRLLQQRYEVFFEIAQVFVHIV